LKTLLIFNVDKTKIAVELFDKRAQQYQDKYMNVDMYSESLDLFCECVAKANPAIFEIACGPGNITKYLLDKRPDFNIFGIDLAPKMIELAKANNPTAQFAVMDCREIESLKEKYDGIMCGFCLPYLSKEESAKLIFDTSLLLLPGGILYLSTMEGDYEKSGFESSSAGEQIFMHYHQAEYLAEDLLKNGFSIIDLQRKFSSVNSIETIDLMIVAKSSGK